MSESQKEVISDELSLWLLASESAPSSCSNSELTVGANAIEFDSRRACSKLRQASSIEFFRKLVSSNSNVKSNQPFK